MARAKPAKQRRRKTALPAFGAASVSLAMASGASANVAPATALAHDPGAPHGIILFEEEIADVSLATFYVFDKENADIPEAGVQLARGCGGCGCRGCGGRGCAVRGCGGCRVSRLWLQSLSRLSRLWLRRIWLRWLRLRLLLGVGAFACVLDRNTFQSSSPHQAHRKMSRGNIRELGAKDFLAAGAYLETEPVSLHRPPALAGASTCRKSP